MLLIVCRPIYLFMTYWFVVFSEIYSAKQYSLAWNLGDENMSCYVYFKATDEIFQLFDNYEIWASKLLNPTDPTTLDRCEDDDPDVACWSVFGHLREGGVEYISDHETLEEAIEFMETLLQMPRKPLVPVIDEFQSAQLLFKSSYYGGVVMYVIKAHK